MVCGTFLTAALCRCHALTQHKAALHQRQSTRIRAAQCIAERSAPATNHPVQRDLLPTFRHHRDYQTMMIPPRLREKGYRDSRRSNDEHSWSTIYNRHTGDGSSLVGARKKIDILNGRPPNDPSLYYDVAPASWAFASAMKSDKRRSISMVRFGCIDLRLCIAFARTTAVASPSLHTRSPCQRPRYLPLDLPRPSLLSPPPTATHSPPHVSPFFPPQIITLWSFSSSGSAVILTHSAARCRWKLHPDLRQGRWR